MKMAGFVARVVLGGLVVAYAIGGTRAALLTYIRPSTP
jgi:hypothetical protein